MEMENSNQLSSQTKTNPAHLLSELKNCIDLLQNGQIINEIEDGITKLPIAEFIVRDSHIQQLIRALESFPSRSDIQINAKLRRRVKRLVDTLTNLQSTEEKTENSKTQDNNNDDGDNIVVTVVKKVPLATTVDLLKSVRSFNALEYALNSMELPDFQALKSAPDGDQTRGYITNIQNLLEKLLLNDNGTLTNRKLRHRIKKIIYVLSGGEISLKRTSLASENTPTSSSSVSKSSSIPSSVVPSVIKLSHPLMTSLNKLKTADELSDLLIGIPSRAEELLSYFNGNHELVKAIYQTLLKKVELSSSASSSSVVGEVASTNHEKIILTAKIRRKVSRFVDALKEIQNPPTAAGNSVEEEPFDEENAEIKIIVTTSKKRKIQETEQEEQKPSPPPLAPPPPPPPPAVVNSSIATSSPPELAAVAPFIAPPLQTYEEFITSLRETESIQSIQEILTPFCSNWEQMLGIGCCKTRRSLKRTLESLSGNEKYQSIKELLEQAMNTLDTITSAAIKAHIDCVTRPLMPSIDTTEPKRNKKQKLETPPSSTPSTDLQLMNESSTTDPQQTSTPSSHKHILFIGQISYETTAQDLITHLKSAGVEGDISVRLLTDKDTGKSRGAAFIDFFGGKRSLKRIMDMHHTVLNGRRINVEHTSRHNPHNVEDNEQYNLTLKQQRMTQKILESEHIDEILREYSHLNLGGKGGLLEDDHLMNRLYAMTGAEVREIMREYQQIEERRRKKQQENNQQKEVGNLYLLRNLITKYDGGGRAVDQTRDPNQPQDQKRGVVRSRVELEQEQGQDQGQGEQEGEEEQNRTKKSGFGKFRASDNGSGFGGRGGGGEGRGGRGGGMPGRGRGGGGVFEVFRGRGGGRGGR